MIYGIPLILIVIVVAVVLLSRSASKRERLAAELKQEKRERLAERADHLDEKHGWGIYRDPEAEDATPEPLPHRLP